MAETLNAAVTSGVVHPVGFSCNTAARPPPVRRFAIPGCRTFPTPLLQLLLEPLHFNALVASHPLHLLRNHLPFLLQLCKFLPLFPNFFHGPRVFHPSISFTHITYLFFFSTLRSIHPAIQILVQRHSTTLLSFPQLLHPPILTLTGRINHNN